MGPSHTLQDNVASLVQPHKCPLQCPYYCDKASQCISRFPPSSSNTLVENHCLRDLKRKGIWSTFFSPSFLYTPVVIWQAGVEVTPLVAGLQLLHTADPSCWLPAQDLQVESATVLLGQNLLLQALRNFCVTGGLLFQVDSSPYPHNDGFTTKSVSCSESLGGLLSLSPFPTKVLLLRPLHPISPRALSPTQGVHASEVN